MCSFVTALRFSEHIWALTNLFLSSLPRIEAIDNLPDDLICIIGAKGGYLVARWCKIVPVRILGLAGTEIIPTVSFLLSGWLSEDGENDA